MDPAGAIPDDARHHTPTVRFIDITPVTSHNRTSDSGDVQCEHATYNSAPPSSSCRPSLLISSIVLLLLLALTLTHVAFERKLSWTTDSTADDSNVVVVTSATSVMTKSLSHHDHDDAAASRRILELTERIDELTRELERERSRLEMSGNHNSNRADASSASIVDDDGGRVRSDPPPLSSSIPHRRSIPSHDTRLAFLLELLEAGVGIEIGVIGGSPSVPDKYSGWLVGEEEDITRSTVSPNEWKKYPHLREPSDQPKGQRFHSYGSYYSYFVAFLNQRFPVRDSPANRAHRNLTSHRVRVRAVEATTSFISSFCVANQFLVDVNHTNIDASQAHPKQRTRTADTDRDSADDKPVSSYSPEYMVDLLLIEFAINDGNDHSAHPPSNWTDARTLFPINAGGQVERILRSVLSNPDYNTAMMMIELSAFAPTLSTDGFQKTFSAEPVHRSMAEYYNVPVVSYSELFHHPLLRLSPAMSQYIFGSRYPFVQPPPRSTNTTGISFKGNFRGLQQRLSNVVRRQESNGGVWTHAVEAHHPNVMGFAMMSSQMEDMLMNMREAYFRNRRQSFIDFGERNTERDAFLQHVTLGRTILETGILQWFDSDSDEAALQSIPILPVGLLPTPRYHVNYVMDYHAFNASTVALPKCHVLERRNDPFAPRCDPKYHSHGLSHDSESEHAACVLDVISGGAHWQMSSNHSNKQTLITRHGFEVNDVPGEHAAFPQPTPLDSDGRDPTTLTMRLRDGPVRSYLFVLHAMGWSDRHFGDADAFLSCSSDAIWSSSSIFDEARQCRTRTRTVRLESTWDGRWTAVGNPTLIYASKKFQQQVAQGAKSFQKAVSDDSESYYDRDDIPACCVDGYSYLHVRLATAGTFHLSGYIHA